MSAQVVISDTVEVAPAAPVIVTAPRAALVSQATAAEAGRVQAVVLRGDRPNAPYGAGDRLAVTVGSEAVDVSVADHVGTPLEVPSCTGTRVHYDTGPFTTEAPNGPDDVDDAYVFSLGCDKDYSISRGGRCVTTNFGDRTSMQASAWTYFGDPATVRSFLRFSLPDLGAAADNLTVAQLTLTPFGESQSTLSGSNAFALHTVAGGWTEMGVTWATQPGVGALVGVGPSGTGSRTFDVTAPVQSWLGGAPNHGFRLALQTESFYRRQSFGTADGPAPPALSMTFENPDYAPGPVAAFGDVEAGETYIVTYNGNGPATIEADQQDVAGEVRDGFVHTFITGVNCDRETLEVFTYTAPAAALAFARPDGTEIDPDAYLPVQDDLIVATASFPGASGGSVRFELANALEFAFDGATGTTLDVPLGADGEAQVTLKSLQWWGLVTVSATYSAASGDRVEQQIPVDSDGDTIADAWERDPANGGTLSLGGSASDAGYDDEDPTRPFPGDRLTKLDEYRGFVAAGTHTRFDPDTDQNLVVSTTPAPVSGPFAVAGMQQLGFAPYVLPASAVAIGPAGILPTAQLIERNGSAAGTGNGLYYVNGVPQPGAGSLSTLGASPPSQYGSGNSFVYLQTIANLYGGNSFPETRGAPTCPTLFFYPVPTSQVVAGQPAPGVEFWVAVFDGSDLNGNGTLGDPVDPFDLLAPGILSPSPPPATCSGPTQVYLSSGNDALDGRIAGASQQETILRTGRHELGHLVGLGHPAPTDGPTVMWQSVGPAKIDDFNATDILNARLK